MARGTEKPRVIVRAFMEGKNAVVTIGTMAEAFPRK